MRLAYGITIATILFGLIAGCVDIDPCTVEAATCTANGGTWTPGPNCGTCTYPPPPDPCDACSAEQTCVDGVCVDPPPPPPPTWVTWQTMPYRWEIKLKKQGKKRVDFTIVGDFGKLEGGEYYKTIWPERYAEGKTWGPLAPDSHPERMAREAAFMEQPCPEWFAFDAKTHWSFDPWFVQDGVNQNHWKNVEAGCGTWTEHHPSWVVEAHGGHDYIVSGMFWAFTVHGNLQVKACIGDRQHCVVSRFRIDF